MQKKKSYTVCLLDWIIYRKVLGKSSLQWSPVRGDIIIIIVAFILLFLLRILVSVKVEHRNKSVGGMEIWKTGVPLHTCLLGTHVCLVNILKVKGTFSPASWRSNGKLKEETCLCCNRRGEGPIPRSRPYKISSNYKGKIQPPKQRTIPTRLRG